MMTLIRARYPSILVGVPEWSVRSRMSIDVRTGYGLKHRMHVVASPVILGTDRKTEARIFCSLMQSYVGEVWNARES
jgi:hypothetical protein